MMPAGLGVPVDEWTSCIQSQIARVRRLENEYQDELISKKIRFKLAGSASLHPGPAIIQITEDEGADMVVVGSRGLDIIRRSLLGSVSDYVIRHAHVPVVVCPNVISKKRHISIM
ncbi:hypothetical protein NP493_574g01075 [Ridgeia piscesae]|uniref:UspA domain-containing protein n=1 Tax=Ridgeia piscesae TaxID=27915 RepID=A0AAD9KUF9_RIDPI|nr:hypothetical protein NP493_574g01075 [Ridgeia piscesae]